VGDRFEDTMGFTVTGPDRFLGSGRPDGRERLPPFLGLLRSSDAGHSWEPVSLLGEREFHVLEAAGERIYGYGTDYESRQASLLVSDDGARSWQQRTPPEPLLPLAIDPDDPDKVVAAGEKGIYSSSDAGGGWRPLADEAGLLAWPRAEALFLVRLDGSVARSADRGLSWQPAGNIDGQPAAFESADDELYVALHDGTIKRSAYGAEGVERAVLSCGRRSRRRGRKSASLSSRAMAAPAARLSYANGVRQDARKRRSRA
jgi:hypothetical protein